MISREVQTNPSFIGFRVSSAALQLTTEEWKLIIGALSAYQHNQSYRPLYEKLVAQNP